MILPAITSLNRYQAAGIHLAISVVVAATVLAALLFVWYPQPYFRLAGGAGLMVILIGVDVVMGPAADARRLQPGEEEPAHGPRGHRARCRSRRWCTGSR